MSIRVQVVYGLSGLLTIKPQWQALAGEHASHYLHFPAWYEAELHARNTAMFFVCIYDHHGLAAVIPLQKSTLAVKGFTINILSLSYPSEMGLCDICSRISLAKKHREIWSALARENMRHAVIKLHYTQHSSHSVSSGITAPTELRKLSHYTKFLDLENGREVFYASYSTKFKRDLRRKLGKAEALGTIALKRFRSDQDLHTGFREFLSLENSGWKGEAGTSIIKQPEKLAYYEQLFERYSEAGVLQINLLSLNDTVIAGQFGVRVGETLYLLKIAYNEAYKEISPGYLLIDKLIEDENISDRIKKLSFVTGVGWIDRWKPSCEPVFVHYLVKNPILQTLANRFFLAKSGSEAAPEEQLTTTDTHTHEN